MKLKIKDNLGKYLNTATPCVLLANWDLLNQSFFHVMVNAVKFNKPNGMIKLTLKTDY